ncbi:uncharacterized protein LOC113382057 [Ctenocephalides felis]|uniref:uncharacterized protein LOC113382057 n=1 Tax=Ctenocephalides felis TaxID=7515 RepID=UPI000E6E5AB0|nr:uncharacterized protein LOC113382057 [Ctenocephalides felis]
MEQHAVEYNNNICNDNSEVYADILSGDENNITESDESDIIISGKVLPIESNSEKSDSDDVFNNVTFTLWSESDIDMDINEFLGNDGIKVFPKDSEIIGDTEDTTIDEMKIFLALNTLMGQVNKSNLNDYWPTGSLIETPVFGKVMPRNRFRQILQLLHFCNNDQTLSLDEAIIPHRGRLSFRVYNPGKKSKYGMLVRLLCESESAYITNFKLYNGNGQKLQNLVEDVLENYANIWHHVYMDNYYSSVELAANLLEKKIRSEAYMPN